MRNAWTGSGTLSSCDRERPVHRVHGRGGCHHAQERDIFQGDGEADRGTGMISCMSFNIAISLSPFQCVFRLNTLLLFCRLRKTWNHVLICPRMPSVVTTGAKSFSSGLCGSLFNRHPENYCADTRTNAIMQSLCNTGNLIDPHPSTRVARSC